MNVMEPHATGTQPIDEDLPLVRAFLDGRESAFDELVRRHQVVAYRVARRIVGGHTDADDVAQEAFLKAYRKLSTFRGDACFRTWLLRIVTHTALNHRRSWWSRRQADCEVEKFDEPGGSSPLESVLDDERRGRLERAIASLPDRQRETVRRRLEGSDDYAGIAQEMGVTVGTVKANIHHAVRNLRRALGVGEDEGR